MDFYCLISGCIFLHPVKLGKHTFEYRMIKEWVKNQGTHPFTGEEVSTSDFVDDLEMKSKVEKYLEENPEEREFQFVDVLSNKRLLEKYFKNFGTKYYMQLLKRTNFNFIDVKFCLKEYNSKIKQKEYFYPLFNLFKYILNNFDYSSTDSNSNTLLHYVCKIDCETLIKQIVYNKKVDLNLKGKYGGYPIHHAVNNNNYDMASFLIENGASLNVADELNVTPFYLACATADLEMMKLTFYEGVQFINSSTDSPLHGFIKGVSEDGIDYDCMEYDYKGILEFLYEKGIDFNEKCEFDDEFDENKTFYIKPYEYLIIHNSFPIEIIKFFNESFNKPNECNVSMEIKLVLFCYYFRSSIPQEKIQYLYNIKELDINNINEIIDCLDKICEDPKFTTYLMKDFQYKITMSDEDKEKLNSLIFLHQIRFLKDI